MDIFDKFAAINWTDRKRAGELFLEFLDSGDDPETALRRVKCSVTQHVPKPHSWSDKAKQRIDVAATVTMETLQRAQTLLDMLHRAHRELGETWVCVDDAPMVAVEALRKMGAITVIKVDGRNRAQLKGAFKQ